MFSKGTRALAVVTLVLSIVGSHIWGGAAPVPVAGTSTTPLDPQLPPSAVLQHPSIGTNPTVLEARRVITPWLTLQTADA